MFEVGGNTCNNNIAAICCSYYFTFKAVFQWCFDVRVLNTRQWTSLCVLSTPYIYVRKKNASLENSLKATIFSRTNFSERFRVCDKAFKSTSSLLTEVSTRKKRSRVTSASMEEYKDCFLSNLRQNVLFLFNIKKHPKPKYVLCFAFGKNGEVISGDSNGNIFIWEDGMSFKARRKRSSFT